MRNRGHIQDLLRNQRRRKNWRMMLGVGLSVAAAIAVGYVWLSRYETGPSETERSARAALQARQLVRESVVAARRPLEVDEAASEEDSEADARSAKWSEGEPVTLRGTLSEHESVFRALGDRNLGAPQIQSVISATEEKFEFEESRPGDKWFAEVDESGAITRFRYKTSPEDIWETVRNSNGTYSVTKIDVPVEKRRVELAGTVDGSLWESIVEVAEKPKLVYRFADIFAYSVDFNRETKPGDRFAMVVEEVYLEGRFLRYGTILAAEYVNQGESFRGYLFDPEDEEDDSGYYDADGKNLKRQFLKSPLASIRVTSQYGMRYHPVEGRQKMHRGVDYGAPTGTEIRAVADGTVEYAGYKGANGKLIVLDHANGFETLYAHLSEIADGIRAGKKVTRKTVIGEVGNSGRSTGSHLHFGMKRSGEYVDPMEVEFARAEPLEGEQLEVFREDVVEPMSKRLDEIRADSDAVNLAEGRNGSDEG